MSSPTRIITPRLEAAIEDVTALLDEFADPNVMASERAEALRAELLEAFEEARLETPGEHG